MSEMNGMTFALGFLALLTLLISVVIWQVFSLNRTKVSGRNEASYRRLVEEATAAQSRAANELGKANEALTELRQRVAAIEKLVREVE